MKKILLSAILAMTFVNSTAQILTRSTDRQTVDASVKLREITSIKTFNLPTLTVQELLAEDVKDRADGVPFRFGHIFDVSLNMENSGEWVELPDGRVWSLKISSTAAHSINLVFDSFFLPKGSRLYLYNSDKNVLQGPITYEHNTHSGQFATDLIPGAEIILEYFEPLGIDGKGVISISKAVHGYINLFSNTSKGFGSSESCNIDINCPQGEDWEAESNAVAMIIVGSNRICSGALVNNACQDFIPYFLTANHCIEYQNVGNWLFRFGYKSPACGGGDGYSYHSYYGSTLRANAEVSDFALLELKQRPLGETGVSAVYIEYPFKVTLNSAPNDTLYDKQWHLNSTVNPLADIRAEQAWKINKERNDELSFPDDIIWKYLLDLDPYLELWRAKDNEAFQNRTDISVLDTIGLNQIILEGRIKEYFTLIK